MSLCIPTPADVARLLGVLEEYGRDEVWFGVWHVYHLSPQPDQITFEVLDGNGTVLRDHWGRIRRQTWQLLTPNLRMAYGDQVHVWREGKGARVRFVPLVPEPQAEPSLIQESWQQVPPEMPGTAIAADH